MKKDESNWYGCTDLSNRATFSDYWKNWSRSFKKTVLIYAHYDVQPQGDLTQWRTPPFEPTIIEGVMYGRGTADNKGPLMAHLNAIEFWLKEYGELPVNIKTILRVQKKKKEGRSAKLSFL